MIIDDHEKQSWTPTGSGVSYELFNSLQYTDLRIQIQAAGGDTNANLRWCVDTQTYFSPVNWTSFNTACWDGTGTNYNGATPLESIMVLVPGSTVDIPFEFCLEMIAPAP